MTWLEGAEGSAPFDAALGLRPELRDLYAAFYGKLWDEELLPASLLELCRLRVAQLHDCEAELAVRHAESGVRDAQVEALADWAGSDLFSEQEQAALTLAEKMPWQHHDLTDEEYANLNAHFGESGVVALTIGVALFDANCRLRLALGTEPAPVEAPMPASSEGPIY
ncbi:MAG: carboxymuconolactone decarboxylase family protein [Chloroflexi bacterium]|nr:carboxymuconolactone decarboxylase family protein [Chloroflexota bacterium]